MSHEADRDPPKLLILTTSGVASERAEMLVREWEATARRAASRVSTACSGMAPLKGPSRP